MSQPMRFYCDKSVVIKMVPHYKKILCGYNHLYRTFGRPTFSVDSGHEFDGVEKCAWHIKFENGDVARITDAREFGSPIDDYTECTTWNVNTFNGETYNQILELIRKHNPNA